MLFLPEWKNQIDYNSSLKSQEEAKKSCLDAMQGIAIGFECPTTITLGLSGDLSKDVLKTKEELDKEDILVLHVKRGGQATLHSPGQLVIYPVINIKKNNMRVRDYISKIEMITLNTLKHFGIDTHKEEGQAGLFTKKGKIAFFGIHVTEGISQHGLSINVQNDLDLFDSIQSCGKRDRVHDSVRAYHSNMTLKKCFDVWIETANRE